MSELEEFLKKAQELNLQLVVSKENVEKVALGEALFHTPLLALTILVTAQTLKRDFHVSEVSTWAGAALSQNFSGLKQANKKLEWSLVLRTRCADALVFLEVMNLVQISGDSRVITVTSDGKSFIRTSLVKKGEYGFLVRGLKRAILNIELKGFSLL